MPNHVTHNFKITGPIEDVAKLKQSIRGIEETPMFDGTIVKEEILFDFSKIIPTIPILENVIQGKRVDSPTQGYIDKNKGLRSDNTRDATPDEETLISTTGYPDWYSWRIDNWGTKWNSYNSDIVDDHASFEFRFDTAWSPPIPVLNKLRDQYPTLQFELQWFDEGWGHAGDITIKPGDTISFETGFVEPNDNIYEKIYYEPPLTDDYFKVSGSMIDTDQTRILNNDFVQDVQLTSNSDGYFELSSTMYSDDPVLTDHDMFMFRKDVECILDSIARHG